MVVEHMHDKLLKLNDSYIRTSAGKGKTFSYDFAIQLYTYYLEIGRPLQEEMLAYLKKE